MESEIESGELKKYVEELVRQTRTAKEFFGFEMGKVQGEKMLKKQLVECQELFVKVPFRFEEEAFVERQLGLHEEVLGLLRGRDVKLTC